MKMQTGPHAPTNTLQFLGHNCYLIENKETFLLIDPWLSNKGAFYGSWFQYPKNHHLQQQAIDIASQKKGFIFYSHEHQDHFDLDTLSKIHHQTTIIIPKFKDRYLKSTVEDLGFSCIEVTEDDEIKLHDHLSIKVWISDIGINHDSAILIRTGDFVFFNQNDCKIFDRLSSIKERIDYYAVQFSGATWHPVCYSNFTDEEKIKISEEKTNNKFNNVISGIRLLNPTYFLPSAGPAIFPYLDPALSFGAGNIFVHQNTLDEILRSKNIHNVLYLQPGRFVNDSPEGNNCIQPPSKLELDAYRKDTECFWESYDPEFSIESLRSSINARLDEIWDLDFQCDTLLQFEWGPSADEKITIDIAGKRILDSMPVAPDKIYIIRADKKYFSLMASGERWQDIYLSLRAEPYRKPDEFNNFINIFLFSDASNIRDAFLASLSISLSKEKIIKIGSDGHCYSINRFCPHQGADLTDAEVNQDNEVVCPRHNWKFSLDKGGISNSGQFTICSERSTPIWHKTK